MIFLFWTVEYQQLEQTWSAV